jgi:rod shape-determining protein MreC
MYDKAVRRRRAVLAALVVSCLVLLTAYFGESTSGGLHSVQRGAMEVLTPIQEGANKALKPFRDLFGWFGDTLDAKSERDKLKAQRDALRQQVAQLDLRGRQLYGERAWRDAAAAANLDAYDPVEAKLFARSASTFSSRIEIDKGSSDGIEVDDPVLNGEGLIGKVLRTSRSSSIVMLLTDQDFGVSALDAKSSEPGSIESTPGSPGDLLMNLVPNARAVRRGDSIVTAGTISDRYPSPFPKGILIGVVNRVDIGEGELDRRIHVRPAADLRRVDGVRVLTKPTADLTASAKTP